MLKIFCQKIHVFSLNGQNGAETFFQLKFPLRQVVLLDAKNENLTNFPEKFRQNAGKISIKLRNWEKKFSKSIFWYVPLDTWNVILRRLMKKFPQKSGKLTLNIKVKWLCLFLQRKNNSICYFRDVERTFGKPPKNFWQTAKTVWSIVGKHWKNCIVFNKNSLKLLFWTLRTKFRHPCCKFHIKVQHFITQDAERKRKVFLSVFFQKRFSKHVESGFDAAAELNGTKSQKFLAEFTKSKTISFFK